MRRALLVDVVVVAAVFSLCGFLAGLAWVQLVPTVPVTRTDVGLVTGEVGLMNAFGNDGWYSALGGATGLVLGVVLTAWRRTHEVVTVLAVTGGAFLASWIMARTGMAFGPDDPQDVLAEAAVGTTAPDQVKVVADAAYLVWPVTAMIGALLALWGPVNVQFSDRAPSQRGAMKG